MPATAAADDDLRYLPTHEWHRRTDAGLIEIGISRFAVEELTDITYVETRSVGDRITANETFGEIESVKATSDLYTGVTGEVVEVNQDVLDNPALINEDCYGQGWLLRVQPEDEAELEALLSADEYEQQHA